jgi:hypothetical protein
MLLANIGLDLIALKLSLLPARGAILHSGAKGENFPSAAWLQCYACSLSVPFLLVLEHIDNLGAYRVPSG